MQSILALLIHRGVAFKNLIGPNIFSVYQLVGSCNNLVRVLTEKVIVVSLSYFEKISVERVGRMISPMDPHYNYLRDIV